MTFTPSTPAGFPGKIGRTLAESEPHWPSHGTNPGSGTHNDTGAKPGTPSQPSQPNILIVLLDDVGFADFGCYGAENATPTIDAIANEGLRFSGFHTTAMCSTTRAALLTGRNHHSVGVGCLANFDSGYPGYRGKIAAEAGTLAEMLRPHGYRNYMVGKWHVTPLTETGPTGPFNGWPLARGFDRFYGFLDAETDQFSPEVVRDNTHVTAPGTYDTGYHLTEDLIDNAITFVSDHVAGAPTAPWMMLLAPGACHAPHQAPIEYIDRCEAKYLDGWDAVRERRLANQIRLGIVPPDTQLPARNDFVFPWEDIPAEQKPLFIRLMAAYAAMLEHFDDHLARLIARLKESGQYENTAIFVMSDNGASQEGGPFGFVNAMGPFNLVAEPMEEKIARINDLGGPDTHSNFPWGWAMAANTPLKRYKQNTHGGGIRDPFVMSWPGKVSDPGSLRHNFCHVVDLTPTIMDMLGLQVPDSINGITQMPIEGTSFAPIVSDPTGTLNRGPQYFEMFGHRGIVVDGWKAVAFHQMGTPFEDDTWELYHLAEDFNEFHDLAEQEPERLAHMIDMWWREADKYKVLPLDDRFAPRFAENAERHTGDRTNYTFWKGMGHLPSDVAPDLRSRSYSITAHVEIPAEGAEGVLISHGDATSGYSLFIRNGYLEHDLNIGGTHQMLRSDKPITPGKHRMGVQMKREGNAGTLTMFIDDDIVGTMTTNDIFWILISWSGLDIGLDRGTTVSDYQSPFEFTGELFKVVIDLANDQVLDFHGSSRATMARD
jgi:arylsulfatase A-like enzyme